MEEHQGDNMNDHTFETHHTRRRTLLAALAGTALLGTGAARAQAGWKPGRPVRMVVPYPAGGSVDLMIRLITPALADRLGQSVIVENRAGATGTIGTGYVYSAPPDGTTLLVGVSDSLSIYPHLAKTPYDATRFVPVADMGSTAFVVVARPGLQVANLKELIALAKKQPLSFANAGMGGSIHMMTLAFGQAAGIDKMLHVPYQGGAPARQAIMSDQVDVFLSLVSGVPQYRSRMKVLGVSSARRVAAVSDVPTFTEQGLPLVRELWLGVLAPPGTPENISKALAREIGDIVAGGDYKTKAADMAMEPGAMTQQEFAAYYQGEYKKWGELARTANVKLD